jgi:hypothetical protein
MHDKEIKHCCMKTKKRFRDFIECIQNNSQKTAESRVIWQKKTGAAAEKKV